MFADGVELPKTVTFLTATVIGNKDGVVLRVLAPNPDLAQIEVGATIMVLVPASLAKVN